MKAKSKRNNLSCPPPRRRGGQHLKKNELEKRKKNNKNTTACKQSKTKNQGKNNEGKITGRPKPKAPSRWRQQLVGGTRSIARFSLLVRLVPCYPDCRIRPACVNYAQPLGVRKYETRRAGSSSTHTTRLLPYGLPGINRKKEEK